jgi:hypothetical protein
MMVQTVLERVIAHAARAEADLMAAQKEWNDAAGVVFADDPLYEERTSTFLEWFALDRPDGAGRLAIERFLADEVLADEESQWARALTATHRSLFAVHDITPGHVTLDDLLGGARFRVSERRRLPGVVDGEIFEARLVADVTAPPEILLTRALSFHPREAAAEVRRLAKRARGGGESREATLFRLARLRLKALRYQHVAARKIYAATDDLPL